MNDKLVQLYLKGRREGYLNSSGSWQDYSAPEAFYKPLFEEEVSVGGEEEQFQRKNTKEWEKSSQLLKEERYGL